MFYGQTNRKIRAFFSTLRDAARSEGGAIGFIEEIDAIGATRAGMGGRVDVRLQPGDAGASPRRGLGVGAAARGAGDVLGRRFEGQDDRGDRAGPARRVHRGRAALSTDEGRAAVADLLEKARSEVASLVEDNSHVVEALRDALLERDELVGDEITDVIAGAVSQPV
ncbi:MAG: hypothetical protein ACRDYY_11320 [Acidimicrobiales bacterium]